MTIPLSASRLHLACAVVAMLALHSCIPEPAYAATPLQLRWTAELSDPKPYNAVLFAGESADLKATLKLYGRAVAIEDSATASLYWQTNGMGSAWWQSPATVTTAGVVSATWTPAMDVGADLYRWHIGVANAASATVYRAFGAFRMQGSPGATPNVLDLPTRWIDFNAVTVSNSPWATPADVAEATEGMLTTEADPVAATWQANHLATANPHGTTAADIPLSGMGSSYSDVQSWASLADSFLGQLPEPGSMLVKDYNNRLGRVEFGMWSTLDSLYIGGETEPYQVATKGDLLDYATTAAVADKLGAEDMPDFGFATSNWVESIRGVHADIASNVVWHVVVSNGHWLIREVQ